MRIVDVQIKWSTNSSKKLLVKNSANIYIMIPLPLDPEKNISSFFTCWPRKQWGEQLILIYRTLSNFVYLLLLQCFHICYLDSWDYFHLFSVMFCSKLKSTECKETWHISPNNVKDWDENYKFPGYYQLNFDKCYSLCFH